MATRGYSRFITWVKIILPVLALAMLSSLVLFSKRIDPEQAIPFAESDVENLAKNQSIGSPTFSTMTENGAAISISALSVLPNAANPDMAFATSITAQIEGGGVDWAELKAENAEIDTSAQYADFEGNVQIETATNYVLRTQNLHTKFDKVDLSAPNKISITGDNFSLVAGSMNITEIENSDENHLIVFKQGVKMVYQP